MGKDFNQQFPFNLGTISDFMDSKDLKENSSPQDSWNSRISRIPSMSHLYNYLPTIHISLLLSNVYYAAVEQWFSTNGLELYIAF